jgi:phosphinothricin acetyltransferase
MIRPATASDLESIARIYNHYILNAIATFEEEPISASEMAGRFEVVRSADLPWLAAEQHGQVCGMRMPAWGGRCSYRFSVESTVYVDPAAVGRGLGTALCEVLLDTLRRRSVHVVIGGIALPNAASVALHERLGFQKVAHFREVGFKFNQWIDVGYWQTTLGSPGEQGYS